jgi:hypothetical protein
MTIKINIIEVASELAEKEMIKYFSDDLELYSDEDEYCIVYTDEAQELFNQLYDKYFDLLYNLQEPVTLVKVN